jgi:hypothetical protein
MNRQAVDRSTAAIDTLRSASESRSRWLTRLTSQLSR